MHRTHRSATLLCLALSACQANVNLGPLSDTDGDATESDSGATTDAPPVTSGSSAPATSEPGTTTLDTSATTDPGTTATSDPGTASSEPGDPTSSTTTAPDDTTDTAGDTDTTGDTGDVEGGCAAPWTRARTISISNEPEKPLTDFQVLVTVEYDDDMNFDFSDLRFVDVMGADLPYWIEASSVPIDAVVWVRVPAIAAANVTEITMCYGNPNADGASDGPATFVFFDGFDSDSLDTDKWETAAAPVLADGLLKVTKKPVYSKLPPAKFPNMIVEAKATDVNGMLSVGASQLGAVPIVFNYFAGQFSGTNGMNMQVLNGKFDLNWAFTGIIGVAIDEGNMYVTRNRFQRASGTGGSKAPLFIGLGGLKYLDTPEPTTIDWVLVRRFTAVEPTTAVGPETNL